MIDLAIIPARGGSVGLPGKNIKPLTRDALIGWTIRAALRSNIFNQVIVTTDCEKIASVAKSYGADVPFLRPNALATSKTPSVDVIHHALDFLDTPPTFALLQPTSPFRNAALIQSAFSCFKDRPEHSLVSVCAGKPLAWQYQRDGEGILRSLPNAHGNLTRRQDAVNIFTPNGALYICETAAFQKQNSLFLDETYGFEMSILDSIDIDTGEDFELAEAVALGGLRTIDL